MSGRHSSREPFGDRLVALVLEELDKDSESAIDKVHALFVEFDESYQRQDDNFSYNLRHTVALVTEKILPRLVHISETYFVFVMYVIAKLDQYQVTVGVSDSDEGRTGWKVLDFITSTTRSSQGIEIVRNQLNSCSQYVLATLQNFLFRWAGTVLTREFPLEGDSNDVVARQFLSLSFVYSMIHRSSSNEDLGWDQLIASRKWRGSRKC